MTTMLRLTTILALAACLIGLVAHAADQPTPATAWRFTRLSRTRYYLPQKPPERRHLNDQGKIPYARQIEPDRVEADSDVRALVDGVVSVTPLSLDITSRVDLPTLQQLYRQADTDLQLKADPPAPRL